MDKKESTSSKKDQPDSNSSNSSKTESSTDHYSENISNVTSSNKDNDETVSQGRPKKRLKGLKENVKSSTENVSSSSKTNASSIDQVATSSTALPSAKKSNIQRNSQTKNDKQKEASSSSQINLNSSDIITSTNKDDNQDRTAQDKQDSDQTGRASSTTSDNNEITTTNKTKSIQSKDPKDQSSDQSNLPRVPPLRIVISSNSNKKDTGDKLISSSNVTTSVSLSSSSPNTTNNEKSFSIDNNQANSTNQKSNDLNSDSTSNALNSSNLNMGDDLDDDNVSNSNSYSKDSNSNAASTGRVTRSQRAAQQSTNADEKESSISNSSKTTASEQNAEQTHSNSKSENTGKDLRKRKNRFKAGQNANQNQTKSHLNIKDEDDDNDSTSSSNSSVNNKELGLVNQLQCLEKKQFQMPSYNCYHLYLNIRRQVDHRRTQQIHLVHPKIPDNFNQFLFNTGSYLLDKESNNNKFNNTINQNDKGVDKNKEFILSLKSEDSQEVPSKLIGTNMSSLFTEQDLERRKLQLQHRIEKDKLRLSIEQEILRVYARAELATANLNLPLLSACTVLKDEEIYNSIDEENDGSLENNERLFNNEPNQFQNPSLNNNVLASGTNESTIQQPESINKCDSKLLNEWLQDVNDKWIKITQDIFLRQKREAESLQAIQKLQWEWKEFNFEDSYVPLVRVNDDFDLLPIKTVNK